MFTRRTATVTISAPLASTAARVSAKSRYLPVPTISRDLKVRPANSNASSFIKLSAAKRARLCDARLSAADKIHHLDRITRTQHNVIPFGLGNDGKVNLDRHSPAFEAEFLDQRRNACVPVDYIRFTVQLDLEFGFGSGRHLKAASHRCVGKRLCCGTAIVPHRKGELASLRRHYPDQVRGVLYASSQCFRTPPAKSLYTIGRRSVSKNEFPQAPA